ncbi:hypothetical protein PAE4_30253 [Bacillus altitudinis]|uniref:Uncharacterized protein n=1 Tax=Bacillus altitudinis TaxID=293387 RepID=A0A653Q6C4_BACAB|nr:hypothetical protein PAE4_30253 [Bacillus altitudinis]VXB31529.1 hypothetical protein BACI9J_130598 [Bacillus altitudinis]VXB38058.1 hypothetical protein BACI348_40600 [Bacillus altitudinis]
MIKEKEMLAEPVFYYYTMRRGMFRPIDSYICIERGGWIHETTDYRACAGLRGCQRDGAYRGFI